MIYIGIDPGKSGGLAAILDIDNRVVYDPMPETLKGIWDWLSLDETHCLAGLEKVGAMPNQGVTSMFTFGRGVGHLEMALIGNSISYDVFSPGKWQRGMGVVSRKKSESKNDFKVRLMNRCQQLFPKLDLWDSGVTKKERLSVCDAILIAEFTRRFHKGIGG